MDKNDYLKKYLSSNDGNKTKVKKKKSKTISERMRVIDDDVDFKSLLPATINNTLEEDVGDNDPTVAEFVDDRPDTVKLLEAFQKSDKWKIMGDVHRKILNSSGPSTLVHESGTTLVFERDDSPEDQHKSMRSSQSEKTVTKILSNRQDSDSENSDKKKLPNQNVRHDSDSDQSPVRNSRLDSGSDQSPVRKTRLDSDSDQSPVRKTKINSDSDQSPARKTRINYNSDQSPSRKSKNNSNSDKSLHKKTDSLLRKRNSKSDHSSMQRRKHYSDSDQSPPRKKERNIDKDGSMNSKGKPTKTLSGAKAGLQSGKSMREEAILLRRKEEEMFKQIGEGQLGKNAETVFRKKSGGKRNLDEERQQEKLKEQKQAEADKKYMEWGMGMKQKQEKEQVLQDHLHEASKPLARYKDDDDLETMLKEKDREGDPMLAFIKKKKGKEPDKPCYKGNWPPNRFNIPPGYRWDGVDRSNGFEKSFFSKINERKAVKDMAYKWSTEDM